MRLFVSYHSADQDRAADLVERLFQLVPGLTAYFAPRSNVGGSYWLPRLSAELADADVMLLLLGARVGAWQELEYFEAIRLGRSRAKPRIVPVLLARDAPGLPFVDQLHCLRLDESGDAAIAAALAADDTGAAGGGPPEWRRTNPYRGLRAYTSQDAAYFFGRDPLTAAIVDALATRRPEILMLVGNSGVGKSSLVLAGLFSTLRSQIVPGDLDREWPATLDDTPRWQTVTFRPDVRPIKALALAFTTLWIDDPAEADAQANAWVHNFEGGSGFADLVGRAQSRLAALWGDVAPSRFLVYVDQCEELYARADEKEAVRFAALMAEATERPDTAVMATLRSDYYGRFQSDAMLFPISRRIDIPPFDRQSLTAVITEPARRLGARVETPEIVAMVAEAAERQPGAVPLLSFLLTEAWDRMMQTSASDGVLRLSKDMLDLSGPLVARAEAFLSAYPERADALRHLVSQRLVHVPKDGEIVRRRAFRPDCSPEEWEAASILATPDWRLLTLSEEGGIPVVEVAHETLIRAWPRARRWIDEEREFLIWRGALEAAREMWERAPETRRDDAALMGLPLATALDWLASRGDAIGAADRVFIERSALINDARQEEAARRTRALAEERERSRRRALWISRIASTAALFLLALGSWAMFERQRAETAADHALAAQSEAEANARRAAEEQRIAEASVARYFATEATTLDAGSAGSLSLLLGVEALRLDHTSLTDRALRVALSRNLWVPLTGHEGGVRGIAFDDEGTRMATAGADGTVRLWRLDDPARPHDVLYRGRDYASDAAIAGGRLVAAVDGEVLVWSLDDIEAAPLQISLPDVEAGDLALSNDGRRLVVSGGVPRGWILDLDNEESAPVAIRHSADIGALAFHPDGLRFAVGGDTNDVAIWDAQAPDAPVTRLTADQRSVYELAFSGDGTTLASGGFEPLGFRYVSFWRLDNLDAGPSHIRAEIGMMDLPFTARTFIIDKTGEQVLLGSDDGTVRRWLLKKPEQNSVLFTAPSAIISVGISSQRWLAAGDRDGTVFLYDMRGGGLEPRSFGGLTAPPFAIDVEPNGDGLVTAVSGGGTFWHMIARPEAAPEMLYEAASDVRSIAHDAAGRWRALGESEGRIVLLDRSGGPSKTLNVADGIVWPMAFHASGDRLLAVDDTGLLEVEPVHGTAKRLGTTEERAVGVHALPDGQISAVTSAGTLLSWPAGLGERGEPERHALSGPVSNAAFDPTGQWLALTNNNHSVIVHDLGAVGHADAQSKVLDTGFRGETTSVFGYPIVFSPDGAWLAFAGGDSTVWLWRSEDWHTPPTALDVQGILATDLAFTPDGTHLVTGGGWDSPPKLWSMPVSLVDRACSRAGRNLTLHEWRRYWGDKPYRLTCRMWDLPDDILAIATNDYLATRNVDETLARLRRFRGDDTADNQVDSQHRTRLAHNLAARALALFDPSGRAAPDVPAALDHLEAASAVMPGFKPEDARFGSGTWNRVCWTGAIWGHAADVLWACELAVDTASGASKAMYRDSRGVARAVTGDLNGAVADFQEFVKHFSDDDEFAAHIPKRRAWLKRLRAGENPMTDAVLTTLRSE